MKPTVTSQPPPWVIANVPAVELHRAKKPPPPPQQLLEDVSAKRKAVYIPRHIIITWLWLALLSVASLMFAVALWGGGGGPRASAAMMMTTTMGAASSSKHPQKVHAYPFNVYEAVPGKISRYPTSVGDNTLGISGLAWDSVSWYRVCCKSNNVLQCFPTDAVALRKMSGNNVFLELRHAPVTSGNGSSNNNNNQSWEPLGGVGARCTLYWMDGKLRVEN
jgi:hypothetical protein